MYLRVRCEYDDSRLNWISFVILYQNEYTCIVAVCFAVLVVMVIIAAAALVICVTVVCIGCVCLRRLILQHLEHRGGRF